MSITISFILITISISFYALKSSDVMYKLIFSPSIVYRRKEFYRFLSSGFIHADFSHLLFNMFAFYSFGEALEMTYRYYYGERGRILFIILYLGGLVISNIPSFLKHKNDSNYYSLGASGGVDAVVFSCILYSPASPICLFYVICLPSFMFGILYIMYTIYLGKNNYRSRINHWAHLSGAIFGLIFNIILEPKIVLFFIYQVKRLVYSFL